MMSNELLDKPAQAPAQEPGDVMLEELADTFAAVYAKFKIHFYQDIFTVIQERETSLSTVEVFCVEIIHALQNPSVNEFASFINISAPNAAYKVNNLIKKGYLKKVQSPDDKREYHLVVTDKYYSYYNLSSSYLSRVVRRVYEHFKPDELRVLNDMLQIMHEELMPEMPTLNTKAAEEEQK